MKTQKRALLAALLLCAACQQDDAAAPPGRSAKAQQGEQAFFAAFTGDQYERLPQAIEVLQQAYDEDPQDPQSTLLLGQAYLWGVAEGQRAASQDLTARITASVLAERYLAEAFDLSPQDLRIPGWLAPVRIGIADATKNQRLRQEALALLRDAAQKVPEHDLFPLAEVLSNAAGDSAEFAEAVSDVWLKLSTCTGGTVDKQHPDIRAYAALSEESVRNQMCWKNGPRFPHRFEGLWLVFGDILVKAGDPDTARVFYKNAQAVASYASWKERRDLEDRIATADERAALYKGGDPLNAPVMAGQGKRQCVLCHAQ